MNTSMNILSLKQAKASIKLILNAGKKLDARIHQVGCSGIHTYLDNGDTSILTDLVKAMPRSSRGNALKYWITKHSNVKWDTKAHGKTGGYVKIKKGTPAEGDLQAAIEVPFYVKADTEASVWNPEKAMLVLVRKLKKECPNKDAHELLQEAINLAA